MSEVDQFLERLMAESAQTQIAVLRTLAEQAIEDGDLNCMLSIDHGSELADRLAPPPPPMPRLSWMPDLTAAEVVAVQKWDAQGSVFATAFVDSYRATVKRLCAAGATRPEDMRDFKEITPGLWRMLPSPGTHNFWDVFPATASPDEDGR